MNYEIVIENIHDHAEPTVRIKDLTNNQVQTYWDQTIENPDFNGSYVSLHESTGMLLLTTQV